MASCIRDTIWTLALTAAAFGAVVGVQRSLMPANSAVTVVERWQMHNPPDDPSVQEQVAAQLALQDRVRAVELYKQIGTIYAGRGEFNDARRVLEAGLALNATDAQLHFQLAGVLVQLHQYVAAGDHYSHGTAHDPHNADAYADWGAMLVDSGRPEAAQKILQEAVRLNDNVPRYHVQLGRALAQAGDLRGASKEFETALELDPKFAPAYFEAARATTLVRSENSEQRAIELAHLAVTLDPHYSAAKIFLAGLLLHAKSPVLRDQWGGLTLLKEAADETGDWTVRVQFAQSLAAAGLPEQAGDQIGRVLDNARERLTPTTVEALLRLRQAYENTGTTLDPSAITDVLLNDSLSAQGMPLHDPSNDPLPDPPEIPASKMIRLPLDPTQPPGPGTALDPGLVDTQPKQPQPSFPMGLPR